jgi:hypothetical protein
MEASLSKMMIKNKIKVPMARRKWVQVPAILARLTSDWLASGAVITSANVSLANSKAFARGDGSSQIFRAHFTAWDDAAQCWFTSRQLVNF